MSGIFISYRHDDSAEAARALYRELSRRFGASNVFIDVETIGPGENFAEIIDEKVGFCDALIAVIGKGWLSSADPGGRRRLDDPHDWVRLEIASAISRGIKVFPVLVGGATLPDQRDLPAAISMLPQAQALDLGPDRFDQGLARLVTALEAVSKRAGNATLWFSMIVNRHKALDPLELHKPEVVWRALRFMLCMVLVEAMMHLPAATGTGRSDSKVWYLLAYATADYIQYLGAAFILHFTLRAFGGKAQLQRSMAAFGFLTAYIPLIAISQVPVWGLDVSILQDVASIRWGLDEGLARLQEFTGGLGPFGILRILVALLAASVLWGLFLAAVFESFRTLHRLGRGIALVAFGVGLVATLMFVLFIVAPYFGAVYTLFASRTT
ncbi:MAG TPA: toll/interleukin-1 receptor domain-containing protein [Candidatus Methylomirabilis sp.]|nr:toll/interleukin-1 receptor domain-containing protein [Candidatus Methylomirabilis sp.]